MTEIAISPAGMRIVKLLVGNTPQTVAELTDAMGVPITACTEDEISALGAAVAAMSITGVHGDPDIAHYAKQMASYGDTTEPDMDNYAIYGELSAIQAKIYPAMQEITEDISQFMGRHPG